jgi:hypothetical protein
MTERQPFRAVHEHCCFAWLRFAAANTLRNRRRSA